MTAMTLIEGTAISTPRTGNDLDKAHPLMHEGSTA